MLTAITKTSQSVYDISLSFSGTANGAETITINPVSAVFDQAGNAATTSQSNNTASMNDFAGPTFSSVDLSSNNAVSTLAKLADTISINITTSESINQPYVVFQSGGAAITNSPSYAGSGTQWTVTYTVNSSDTDGSVTFTIDASDNAGNSATQRTTTTNSSSVNVDKTVPPSLPLRSLLIIQISLSPFQKMYIILLLEVEIWKSRISASVSGGTATSPVLTAITKTSQSVYDISLSFTNTADGSETITINPVSSGIFDQAGNEASTTQSNNTVTLNDQTTPTLTTVDLSSNNSIKTKYASADDVVTLNIT